MNRRIIGGWALGATLGAVVGLGACGPRTESGGCSEDLDCSRGQQCELDSGACVASQLDTSAAESPAPATFDGRVVAFHRGEVCLPLEVKSGESMPVLMRPCLHPCLDVSSFEFRHNFECRGSRCDALALMWMVASSGASGCPEDAFAQFDPGQCTYDTEVEFQLATQTSNGPIRGTMRIEVPFLTNEDAAVVASDPDDVDAIEALVRPYPESDDRVPDGRAVSLLSSHPSPPSSCRGGACTCYPIGF